MLRRSPPAAGSTAPAAGPRGSTWLQAPGAGVCCCDRADRRRRTSAPAARHAPSRAEPPVARRAAPADASRRRRPAPRASARGSSARSSPPHQARNAGIGEARQARRTRSICGRSDCVAVFIPPSPSCQRSTAYGCAPAPSLRRRIVARTTALVPSASVACERILCVIPLLRTMPSGRSRASRAAWIACLTARGIHPGNRRQRQRRRGVRIGRSRYRTRA